MVFDKPRLPREAVAPGISHSWNRCWREEVPGDARYLGLNHKARPNPPLERGLAMRDSWT